MKLEDLLSLVGRLAAFGLAVVGWAYNDVEDLLFAIFLWIVMDTTDRRSGGK